MICRIINSLSYYKYKLILRKKCKEYDIYLIEKNGHYISKTCNNCEKLNGKLDSKKIFECL